MQFNQFLGNSTDAIVELSYARNNSLNLHAINETGNVLVGKNICPLRVYTKPGDRFSILKSMSQKVLGFGGMELQVDIISMIPGLGTVGTCIIIVPNTDTSDLSIKYLGIDERSELCVFTCVTSECLWKILFTGGITAFTMDSSTFVSTHFVLSGGNVGPSSPTSPLEKAAIEYFDTASESERGYFYDAIKVPENRKEFNIFAVCLGDDGVQLANPTSESYVPRSVTQTKSGIEKTPYRETTIIDWLQVRRERLHVVKGVEAALYGCMRTVQIESSYTDNLFPIVSISASIVENTSNNIAVLIMGADRIARDVSADIAEWELPPLPWPTFELEIKGRKIKDALSKTAYEDLIKSCSDNVQRDNAPIHFFIARWYVFLANQIVKNFLPKTVVLSGSLFQTFWSHFSRNIFRPSLVHGLQYNMMKTPFKVNACPFLEDVLEGPVFYKGTDVSSTLGAAIAAIRNISGGNE